MHVQSEIKKWGNSLAIRITTAMAEAHLQAGTKIDIEVGEDMLIIRPLHKVKKKLNLPFTEDQLISDLTPYLAHADELATPIDKEFGE